MRLYVSNRITAFYTFLMLFLVANKAFAADAQQVFSEANQAYQQGNYAQAIEKYEQILRGGVFSNELFGNLGNAYFRQNQLGRAILNYERALRFAPTDATILHNLDVAKMQIIDNPEPPTAVFIVRAWHFLQKNIAPDRASYIGIFLLWLGAGGIAIWLIGQERGRKKLGFIVAAIALPLSILPFFLAKSSISKASEQGFGIIVAKDCSLNGTPDLSDKPLNTLHEGIKAKIIDETMTAILVQLDNGEQGWLKKEAIEKI